MGFPRAAFVSVIALAAAASGRAQDPTFKSDLLARVVDGEGMLPARWQNREEVLAYEALVLYARQFPADVLAKSARRDLRLPLLLGPDKARYRGTLVHLDGSLRLLETMDLSAGLTGMAEGLTNVYRGWIALDGYKDDLGPVLCVVDFTELPAGLTAVNAAERHVGVDGFFFKVMKYDTREPAPGGVSEKSATGKVARLAPLFIARTVWAQPVAAESGPAGWETPVATVVGSILLIGAAAGAWVVVSWWLRREDARVRERLQSLRPGAVEQMTNDEITNDE
ncbi:MAG TPA: hypothetical protein VH120_16520, partial [Gemmataceae bacterium]|nr:hypothetical protein [Gemmataceae bacterium]